MKKSICTLVSLVTSVTLLSTSANVFAYNGNSSTASSRIWDTRNNSIVSLVKSTPTKDIDAKIAKYFSDKSVYEKNVKLFKEAVPQNSGKIFISTVYKNISISKDRQISFYTDGSFAITSLEVKQPSINESDNNTLAVRALSTSQYKSCTLTKNYYGGVFGNLLYSITDCGQFRYDGCSVWDDGSYAYYTFGDVFGNVSQWSQGACTSGYKQKVYGRGSFGCGYNVLGNPIQLTSTWRELNLYCDIFGNISYTSQ